MPRLNFNTHGDRYILGRSWEIKTDLTMFLPDADGAFRNSRDSIKFPSVDDQITVLPRKRTNNIIM